MTETTFYAGGQVKAILVWLLLLGSTIAAWLESSALTLTALMIMTGLALLKVVLVIYSYMEIGSAVRWLQLLCGLWVVLVFGMILFCFAQPVLLAGWLR